jgi:gas vesicle protein
MKSTIAFGVGAVIGAGVAMLFAPRSIEQVREGLAGKITGSIERGQARVREIAGQAIRVVDQAKGQVQRVQDAVDAGVRAFEEAKNSTSHRPPESRMGQGSLPETRADRPMADQDFVR